MTAQEFLKALEQLKQQQKKQEKKMLNDNSRQDSREIEVKSF